MPVLRARIGGAWVDVGGSATPSINFGGTAVGTTVKDADVEVTPAAFPPPTLPTSRVNSSALLDTHPGDHNAISQAINDIVGKLGADPADGNGTVQTAIFNLDLHAINERIPNYIGAVDNSTTGNGFALVSGSSVVVTNVNGVAVVTFPKVMFSAAPPFVSATNGDAVSGAFHMDIVGGGGTTTANFQVKVYALVGGTPAANTTIRINWLALGPK